LNGYIYGLKGKINGTSAICTITIIYIRPNLILDILNNIHQKQIESIKQMNIIYFFCRLDIYIREF